MDLQSTRDLPGKSIYRSSPYAQHQTTPTNVRSDNRIISLKPIKGKSSLTDMGNVDNRLYRGGAKLHAKLDNGLWGLYIDGGSLPAQLEGQKWTRWENCLDYVTKYFKSRNLEVTEVID